MHDGVGFVQLDDGVVLQQRAAPAQRERGSANQRASLAPSSVRSRKIVLCDTRKYLKQFEDQCVCFQCACVCVCDLTEARAPALLRSNGDPTLGVGVGGSDDADDDRDLETRRARHVMCRRTLQGRSGRAPEVSRSKRASS